MSYMYGAGVLIVTLWLSWHISPLVGLGFMCIAVPLITLIQL